MHGSTAQHSTACRWRNRYTDPKYGRCDILPDIQEPFATAETPYPNHIHTMYNSHIRLQILRQTCTQMIMQPRITAVTRHSGAPCLLFFLRVQHGAGSCSLLRLLLIRAAARHRHASTCLLLHPSSSQNAGQLLPHSFAAQQSMPSMHPEP
jgi:hypothetical protein